MPVIHLLNRKSFPAAADTSILDAASAAGIVLEHSCRTGRCGSCRTQVLEGSTTPLLAEEGLNAKERDAGWVLSCARSATSDLRLGNEDLDALAGIKPRTLPCRIHSLELLAPDVLKVLLRLPPNAQFKYLSGQHINVIARDGTRRSYSIANAVPAGESAGLLELQIRRVDGGAMSRYWFDEAKTGDLLRFEGPQGSFYLRECAGQDLVFLATGTGIAPIMAMLGELGQRPAARQPRTVTLLWGGRSSQDHYLTPELARLRYVPVLSRAGAGWSGARGHVQDALIHQMHTLADSVVYACGSLAMTDGARAALHAAGLPAGRFHADAFVSSAAAEALAVACH
jgi:CDP-4-dehydro-6-deoxyglucose reductase